MEPRRGLGPRLADALRRTLTPPRGISLLVLGLLAAACRVSDRAALVGRYEAEDGHQALTLEEDGTCRVERAASAPRPCEWVLVVRDGDPVLELTLQDGAHRARYVLTPRRLPGSRVTIPLGPRQLLRKVD